ncbi:hypothetical protein [Streptomyces sp. NPDC127039]|uniref:hypothetical protein n=1 Tax=Streptomyces sp. NPDC127039 TaxID=3347115 RepID=UPI0036529132
MATELPLAPASPHLPTEPAATASAQSGAVAPPADHDSAPAFKGPRTEDGPLWADGSIPPDDIIDRAQSNVTLKTDEPLTALTVELLLAPTNELSSTSGRQSLPAEDFTVSEREEGGMLVRRWTLKAGSTVPPGTHLFVGEYQHAAAGRDAKDDTYRATAKTVNGTFTVAGDFARTG